MSVIQKVTLATLKKNKKRTVVTILGTATAVAMITAIAVLFATMLDGSRQSAIANTGSWHARIDGYDKTFLPELEATEGVEQVDVRFDEGYAKLNNPDNLTRRHIQLASFSPGSFDNLPVEVVEGRLPQMPGEIVLSEEFQEYAGMNWQVGDTLTLDFGYFFYEYDNGEDSYVIERRDGNMNGMEWVGEGQRSFTLVGTVRMGYLQSGYADYYTALSVFDPADTVAGQDFFSAFVYLTNPGEKSYLSLHNINEEVWVNQYEYAGENPPYVYANSALLVSEGSFHLTSYTSDFTSFIAVLLLIVVVGSVMLIANAFTISLSERLRQLGMLAGVGATRHQKRNSVLFEALIIGLFAIPAGIIGGIVGIGITIGLLAEQLGEMFSFGVALRMVVPGWALVFTVLFSAMILLISAWWPARRASRIAPVEAIRSGGTIKVSKARTSRLLTKLFGFEAAMGVKNSKRSRKRYWAILSSLMVSVVLFLTVFNAMEYTKRSAGLIVGERLDYNVQVYVYGEYDGIDEIMAAAGDVRSMEEVKRVDALVNLGLTTQIPVELLTPKAREYFYIEEDSDTYNMPVYVWVLDDNTFARFLRSAGLSENITGTGASGVYLNEVTGYVEGGYAGFTQSTIAAGDALYSALAMWDENGVEARYEGSIGIAAVTGYMPSFINERYSAGDANIVMNTANYKAMQEQFGFAPKQGTERLSGLTLFVDAKDANSFYEKAQNMTFGGDSPYVYNLEENNQRANMLLLVIQTFAYGFIVLITLVCAANIFNTISTGIALRAREFAMLRSVGLTRKGFNRMMDCETLFYGLKALFWGILISVPLSIWLYRLLAGSMYFAFFIPWQAWSIAAAGVFLVVGSTMLYARSKVRSLNIAETLKKENW